MPRRCGAHASEDEALAEATPDALIPVVYEQLRSLAANYLRRETGDQMLEPAVLVHEAYLRLAANPPGAWTGEEHFFAVAARSMRQVLIDHARRRRAVKRGFGQSRVSLELVTRSGPRDVDIREVDDAIGRLSVVRDRAARVVELRFFAGLTNEQIAKVLGVSRKTVVEEWALAREWLADALSEPACDPAAQRTA